MASFRGVTIPSHQQSGCRDRIRAEAFDLTLDAKSVDDSWSRSAVISETISLYHWLRLSSVPTVNSVWKHQQMWRTAKAA